jgi:restriction endonuclease Mrr
VESKGTETSTNEAVEALAKELNLTEDDLKEMLPSGFWRITQRSTGRQKQAHFLTVGKLLVKGRYRFKSYSFFAFAACELNVRYQLIN